ncbi:hypothetical protein [Caulobacter sp. LjRoot300]|uniref:hypothetical protein n=1 Tax=Caulobacter sp. LjRoot300 TaxID=3342321 RepID=UPI003ECF0C23
MKSAVKTALLVALIALCGCDQRSDAYACNGALGEENIKLSAMSNFISVESSVAAYEVFADRKKTFVRWIYVQDNPKVLILNAINLINGKRAAAVVVLDPSFVVPGDKYSKIGQAKLFEYFDKRKDAEFLQENSFCYTRKQIHKLSGS